MYPYVNLNSLKGVKKEAINLAQQKSALAQTFGLPPNLYFLFEQKPLWSDTLITFVAARESLRASGVKLCFIKFVFS